MKGIGIRSVRSEDAPALYEIRTMEGVRENVFGMHSDRVIDSVNFINSLDIHDHMLVAELKGGKGTKVVGAATLCVDKRPRSHHCAHLGIMVHADYQGKGIGRKLIKGLLDIADNYIKLVRVELGVFYDNENAIKLYRSLGFVIEGTRKYAAIRDGKYQDILMMARYRV